MINNNDLIILVYNASYLNTSIWKSNGHMNYKNFYIFLVYLKKPGGIWLISLLETIYSQLCFQFRFNLQCGTRHMTSHTGLCVFKTKTYTHNFFEWTTMKLKLSWEFHIFVSRYFSPFVCLEFILKS